MTKWVTKKLGEYISLQGGFAFQSKDFADDGVPLVRIGDISLNGLNTESAARLPFDFWTDHKDVALDVDDTIIAMSGASVGKCTLVKAKNIPALLNQRVGRFKVNKDIDKKYLYYIVSSFNYQQKLLQDAIGGAQPNVSPRQIESVPCSIPVNDDGTPDLTEQKRIASILSSADNVIATSEALIEKYKSIKQGMLTDLLTPKKEWKKVKLGECCETELGKTLDSGRNTGKYRPYLCALNVLWGKIDLSTIKQMRIEESEKERYLVKRGDLLVCEGGDIGRCAIWNSDEEIYYQNALHRVRFKEEYDAAFFMYLLGHYNDLNLIEQYGKGLTIKHLNQTSFRGIPVIVPNKTEQKRISDILSSIDAKIAAEEKVVEKYKGVKKGLMEELMKSDE